MILVTGGTGLVGAHLLYQLSLEAQVPIRAIHRAKSEIGAVKRIFSYYSNDYEALFAKITWKIADINDIPALQEVFQDITHVYHCAALISFNNKDDERLRKTNIEGTANLVNISLECDIKKFCYVSSIAAIGKLTKDTFVTEDNDWNAEDINNGYAISKFGAENEVWRASQEGLNVVIVNPGVILGSGLWQSGTGKLFSRVYKGFKYYTEGVTGYVGVQDVVKIMMALMNSSINAERYILVSENRSFKSVLFAIADELKVKRPSIKVTPFLRELAWRLAAIKSFFGRKPAFITKESIRSSHRKTNYSNQKVTKALGYEFEPIEKTIKSICANFNR
jgi:nucleoside-diphosphate-sugar epimerase